MRLLLTLRRISSDSRLFKQGGKTDCKSLGCEETDGELEAKVVRPVEATLLGLQKDTVYWQRGLLASPAVSP